MQRWRRPALAVFLGCFIALLAWWATSSRPTSATGCPTSQSCRWWSSTASSPPCATSAPTTARRPISSALLRQDVRPAQARVGGSLRRVLDGAAHRAHDSQLRLRGWSICGLDRDAQEKNESYFGPGRLLPAIRAVLRSCRRARRHPPAHELPQGSAGRCSLYRLHGPAENGRRLLREYLHKINALRASPSSTTRSPPTAPATSGCTAG